MIRLFFIRHGATAGNVQKRYIGYTDEPLCELGISQILSLREKNLKADRLFVSPMLRARQTADILFPQMGYTVVQGFRETNFGSFEGKSADELSDDLDYRAWVASSCNGQIPGGECTVDFKTRCCAAFCEIMKTIDDGDNVAFIVHGGVIMAILEAFARPSRGFYDYHVDNGEYIQCEYDAGIITVSIPIPTH